MSFPVTRKDGTIDDYHGMQVADPYRWLEDDASEETRAWSEAQHAVTRAYLDEIGAREQLKSRYTALYNYARFSAPHKEGNRYYFAKNSGLQNQAVLYVQQHLRDEPRMVLDPNMLSDDGTVALTNQSYSKDGTLLAYATSTSGSDWQEVRIRHVDEGSDFPEVICWCKFVSVAWSRDGKGFFYNRLPEPGTVAVEDQNNYNKVYWHTLGTPQEEDQLIFEQPDVKELSFSPTVSDDGAYLLLDVWWGTDPNNRIYYRDLRSDGPFVRLLDEADASYGFIGNDGAIFYFQTNFRAARGRIIAIDTTHPERENWRELVPEQVDVLDFVLIAQQQFVVSYLHDAHHQLKLYQKDGQAAGEIALPTLGSVVGLSGKPDESELFIQFTSYLYAPSSFRYDFTTRVLEPLNQTQATFDPSGYETTQVFCTSRDGTRVPMFLTHKKGLQLDGNNPVLLYAYGGFNISLTPNYSITPLVWIEHGGVYAVANLRGGNEYGEAWHQAGMLEKKQNVFDDFIAAAEWLIENKYTTSSRLSIEGGSNGGLLVATCMTQRPDLYGAIVCRVPVIDMLRYHRFTVGRFWIPEYGDAEHNAEQFKFLYAYSPLHNVREGRSYPATLIMTADSDDRVVPAHARKFAATLQEAQAGEQPILLRVEMKAGHGFGKPTTKIIDEECDILAFLFDTFQMQ
ncbi:MAG TPA: prolyl oligopeptidase family serine peptidase [Dictyobacter sp.]|nr:prolyl oligopeptidase family serine peptidase [Dictyobacter sp.]